MQYNLDMRGRHADIFKALRKILLSYRQIKEVKNEKQTSYSDAYGVIVMMRSKGDTFVVAFGKGVKLQKKFPQLQGTGKTVRHLYFKQSNEVDEALLCEMIEEAMVLNIEAYEMKLLRSTVKK